MPVRLIAANPRVEQVRSQVAVARGPVVYCLESTDLPVAASQPAKIKMIPYFAWNNRGEPERLVWLPFR